MPDPNIKSSIESGEVTPEEKAAIEKSIKAKEQAPRMEEQTESIVDWRKVRDNLGDPFQREHVPFRKLRQMRLDTMIAFALHYIVVPAIRAPYHFEAFNRQGPDPQVAAFMHEAYKQIHGPYMDQRQGALEFGFQVMSKRFQHKNPGGLFSDSTEADDTARIKPVWEQGSIEPIIWKTFIGLIPEKIEPVWNKDGTFDGVKYELPKKSAGSSGSGFQGASSKGGGKNDQTLEIDVYHALWITNEKYKFWGSIYGFPRIAYAYPYWWSYWFRWAMADRAFERMAIPPMVAYFPEGNYRDPEDPGSESVPNWTIALEAARALRSNSIAAVPSTLASTGMDERGTQKREWEFEFVEPSGKNFELLDRSFGYLDTMKLRSLFVPEQAVMEGEGGTSSRNVAEQMADIFIQSEGVMQSQIDQEQNQYVFPQIAAINFPEFMADGGVVRKVTRGMAATDQDMIKQIIQLLGQNDPDKLGADLPAMLDQLRVPTLDPIARQAERQRAVAEAAAAQAPIGPTGTPGLRVVPLPETGASNGGSVPSATNGSATGAVGFSDITVYDKYEPAITLNFADNNDFLAGLPQTKHYEDEAIRALAIQLRNAWKNHLTSLYSSFATYLATQPDMIELADDTDGKKLKIGMTLEKAKKVADKLLKNWDVATSKLESISKQSRNVIDRAVKRAIKLEALKLNTQVELAEDQFNDWVDTQTGRLIKSAHGTVQDQLRDFLIGSIRQGKTSGEISQGIREHFDEFPEWKTNQIARSEVRDAVNAATLLTASAVNARYVVARDAQLPGPTDEECEERDGKLLTVREAWKEAGPRKTHPNDTLGFDIVPRVNLVFEDVEEMPEDAPEGSAAFFNDETSTIFFLTDAVTEDQRENYITDIAEELIKRGSMSRELVVTDG